MTRAAPFSLRFILFAGVLSLPFALPAPAPAQQPSAPPNWNQPRVTPPRDPNAPAQPTLDIQFPGGTVADFLAAIQKASGSYNVITFGDLSQVPMSPVTLTGVPFSGAMYALDSVQYTTATERFRIQVSRNDPDNVWTVRIEQAGYAPGAVPSRTSIFSIFDLANSGVFSAEDVLAAVDAALSSFDDPPTPKYHPDTGILIVRGTGEQISVVDETLSQIRKNLPTVKDIAVQALLEQVDSMWQLADAASRYLDMTYGPRMEALRAFRDDELTPQEQAEVRDLEYQIDQARSTVLTMTSLLGNLKAAQNANSALLDRVKKVLGVSESMFPQQPLTDEDIRIRARNTHVDTLGDPEIVRRRLQSEEIERRHAEAERARAEIEARRRQQRQQQQNRNSDKNDPSSSPPPPSH